MQYLAIFLLVGLGVASAYTSDFDSGLSIDRFETVDAPLQAGGWIAEQMRNTFEKMVEAFEKAMEEGQTISERAFKKAEEIYHKLMDWGIEVSEKVKEAFERIANDFNKNRASQKQQAGGWIAEQMRNTFEKMVEAFEKAIEEGQTISERAFRKAEEIYHKLMDWGIEVSEKVKEAFERIANDFSKNRASQKQQAGGWIAEQMRNTFEKMVEAFEKAIEEGQTISERAFKKAEEIYHKLLDWGVEVSEKVKEAFDRISQDLKNRNNSVQQVQQGPVLERLKESFEKIVNKIKERFEGGEGIGGSLMKKAEDLFQKLKDMRVGGSWFEKIKSVFEDLRSKMGRNSVQRGAVLERLKEAFENVIAKIREAFESGKGVRGDLMKKAEDIFQKLKDMRVGGSWFEKIKSVFEDLRNKVGRNSVQRGAVADKLKETFENVVNKIKEAFENGKGVRGDLMKKAEDIYEKLKNMRVEISDKIKSIFEDLRNKMGKNGPVSQDASISNILEQFRKLKQLIKEKFDPEKLKEKVEQLFGKGSEIAEQLIEMLRTKGEKAKQKILDWIDRIIPDKEERSISDVYDKVREYFKDLQLDLKERFTKFGEFIKEQYEKSLEKGKTRAENIKKIAKEFIEDTRHIGKDMAEEALGFFREYKKDLGKLYDNVVDKIAQILKS